MVQLTDNQRALILLAVQTEGRIENYPDNLKGGARASVTRGLLLHGLVAGDSAGYALTGLGYEAVGLAPPVTGMVATDDTWVSGEGDTDIESNSDGGDREGINASSEGEPEAIATPQPRKATRIDQVVVLMLRPEGVTIRQVMEATGWQQHSVRGFFAGTLKKKGYTVINEKAGKQDRVYRIAVEDGTGANPAAEGGEDE